MNTLFAGLIMICQSMNPTNCMVITGTPVENGQLCQLSIIVNGLPYVQEEYGEDVYVAGVSCMEVQLMDDPA